MIAYILQSFRTTPHPIGNLYFKYKMYVGNCSEESFEKRGFFNYHGYHSWAAAVYWGHRADPLHAFLDGLYSVIP